MFNAALQVIERQIVVLVVVRPVVGNFEIARFEIGVDGIGCQLDIVIGVDPDMLGERLGRVRLPFIRKRLRQFSEIDVEHRLDSFGPSLCDTSAPPGNNPLEHSRQHGVHFAVIETVLADATAGVHVFRDDAVIPDLIDDVVGLTAGHPVT